MGALWLLMHTHGGAAVSVSDWWGVAMAVIAAAGCWYADKAHRGAVK